MTDKLKELALAATPGPWKLKDRKVVNQRDNAVCGAPVYVLGGYAQSNANASYIAAASPDAILALISDLENERRKVTELVDGYEKDQAELKRLRSTVFTDNTQTVVNAEKRIAELEADVERLTLEKKAAAMNYEAVIEGLKESATLWNKRYQDACQDRIALRQKYGHEIEALEAEVERLKALEPIAWASDLEFDGETEFMSPKDKADRRLGASTINIPLYLAPGAAPRNVTNDEDAVLRAATLKAGTLVHKGRLASGAAPKTLSDFVHSSDSEREKIGNVVAAKADEAMDKLVKLSEELGLYDGAAQKENT